MSKEKKQNKIHKNYNSSEWVAIGHSNRKITIEQPENRITFMKKPQDIKVMIWGYELCNGAEWKDFLDVVNKLGKEKTDLEAKLAESEADKKALICDYESRITKEQELMSWLEHNNEELKQQLAEKEKEIENLRSWWAYEKDQDKISFAVEQLTEIRDYVKECWSLDTTEGKVRLDIAKKIRLKIEQLTHQHEDKGE